MAFPSSNISTRKRASLASAGGSRAGLCRRAKEALKALVLSAVLFTLGHAQAQPASPPAHIEPGPSDKTFVICTVTPVNEDHLGWLQTRVHHNLWTNYMTGGKFEATGPSTIRVMSASPVTASDEVFAFYKKYAAAAIIRGPEYDKGSRPKDAVVKECVPEPGRQSVDVHSSEPGAYAPLKDIYDHLYAGIKAMTTKPAPEQLALMVDRRNLPIDAFEHREEVQRRTAIAEARIASAAGPLVQLTGQVRTLNSYSFDSNSFSFRDLRGDAAAYDYTMQVNAPHPGVGVSYDLFVPATLTTIKPSNISDAKRIEKLRAANQLKLVSLVRITGATLAGQMLTVKATLEGAQLRAPDGALVFQMTAR